MLTFILFSHCPLVSKLQDTHSKRKASAACKCHSAPALCHRLICVQVRKYFTILLKGFFNPWKKHSIFIYRKLGPSLVSSGVSDEKSCSKDCKCYIFIFIANFAFITRKLCNPTSEVAQFQLLKYMINLPKKYKFLKTMKLWNLCSLKNKIVMSMLWIE